MIVYKVVRISENDYLSLWATAPGLMLKYKVGEKTAPVTGPIFAHQSMERTFLESQYTDAAGFYPFQWAVLKCEGALYGSLDPRSSMMLLRPPAEILTLENARAFWEYGELHSSHAHEVQTRDTVLCAWVKPIQIWAA